MNGTIQHLQNVMVQYLNRKQRQKFFQAGNEYNRCLMDMGYLPEDLEEIWFGRWGYGSAASNGSKVKPDDWSPYD